MYFNTVLTDSAKLLKPLLVFTFIMLAILAGLTRIIQFRNHPVDVYCGWILGAAIAIYLVTPHRLLSVNNLSQTYKMKDITSAYALHVYGQTGCISLINTSSRCMLGHTYQTHAPTNMVMVDVQQ